MLILGDSSTTGTSAGVDTSVVETLSQAELPSAGLAPELAEPDVASFLNANRIFHEIITDAAQSPRLKQVLAMLVETPVVLRTARNYSINDLQQSARDHDELISAFRAADASWARAVMGSHLRRAFHTFADATEAAE